MRADERVVWLMKTTTTPGQYLREVREHLGMTLRAMEEASAVVASEESRAECFISASHLNRIEMDLHVPSLPKLFTICAVYGLAIHDLLRRYGADSSRIRAYRERFVPGITRPVPEIHSPQDQVPIPVRLDPSFRWEVTHLINRIVALWGEIPASFLIGCNPRRHTYGFVGLADKTMHPLIRPGSLVMIDTQRRRVSFQPWQSEAERPIYFIELRNGYRCAWCEIAGSTLRVIPRLTSGCPVQDFSLPTEAEIVGQVVGVAMRLVPPSAASAEDGSTVRVQSAVAK